MNTVKSHGVRFPDWIRMVLVIVLIGVAVSLLAVAKTMIDEAVYNRTIVQQVIQPLAVIKDKYVGFPEDEFGKRQAFVTLTLGNMTDHQASFAVAGLKYWGTRTLNDYGWGKHIVYISQKSPGSFVAHSGVTVKVEVTSPTSINLTVGETFKGFLFKDVEGVAIYLGTNTDEDKLVFMISVK